MQLNTVQWLSLPLETRNKLVEIFNIPRSSSTEVEDNRVVSDGYTHHDLAYITIEAMQGFLLDTVENDYFKLFHRVLDAIKPEEPKIEEIVIVEDAASEGLPVPEPEIINTNNIIQDEPKKEDTTEDKGTDNVRSSTKRRTNKKA